MTLIWIIGILAYYIIGRIAIEILDNNFEFIDPDVETFQKVPCSIIWPVVLFFFFVEWLVNKIT